MLLNIFYSHLHNFQVTCEYLFEHGAAVPLRVHTVVISLQHTDDVTLDVLRKEVMERIILDVIPEEYRDDETIYYINPCGKFVIGGPMVRLFECLNVRYMSAAPQRRAPLYLLFLKNIQSTKFYFIR